MYPECRGGMIQMMRDLREALPDDVIIMNQGFDIIADVAPLADGFMIESFTATYDFENKRYVLNDPASLDFHLNRAEKLLNPAIEEPKIRVLVLDYAEPQRPRVDPARRESRRESRLHVFRVANPAR